MAKFIRCYQAVSFVSEQKASIAHVSEVDFLQKLYKHLPLTPSGTLDLLSLYQTCEFPDLLGRQLLAALDGDRDGEVTAEEFCSGLEVLYGGATDELAELMFTIMDFGEKGFVSRRDAEALLKGWKERCPECGDVISPSLKEMLEETFKTKSEIDLQHMEKSVQSSESLISALRLAIISGFPPAVDASFQPSQRHTCVVPIENEDPTRVPITINGKKGVVYGRQEALVGYKQRSEAEKLWFVLILKNLFTDILDDTSFLLSDLHREYHVQTQTVAARDELLEYISRVTMKSEPSPYEIIGRIITSPQSIVSKALHKPTGRLVAIKTIPKTGLTRKAELAARREISICRSLRHPNLIALLDSFETKTEISLVTEYLSEGSLFDYMDRLSFRISEETAKGFVRDIVKGLLFLHDSGIIHRDIKLENVLISKLGGATQLKICDFGLSVAIGPLERVNDTVGTLKYAAPELLSHIYYGFEVDCWSLGVVAYVLLSGLMPFARKTEERTALAILKRKANFSLARFPNVSPEAVTLLEGLLRKDPRSRLPLKAVLESEWLRDSK